MSNVPAADEASPSGKSAAALEQELADAKKTITAHNGERMLFGIFVLIVWDVHVFSDFQSWAPTLAIFVLELIALFILAYRLNMGEVIALFWASIRAYGQQNPGTPPDDDTD